MVQLDERYISDKAICNWLLPVGMSKVRGASNEIIYNSLDMSMAYSRQTMATFFNNFKERTSKFKIKPNKTGYIGIMSNPVPLGVNVSVLYKELTTRDATLELYQYIFQCIGAVSCIITKNGGNLFVDFELKGIHYHMVWRSVDSSKVSNGMVLVQNVKKALQLSENNFTALENVSRLLKSNTKAIF